MAMLWTLIFLLFFLHRTSVILSPLLVTKSHCTFAPQPSLSERDTLTVAIILLDISIGPTYVSLTPPPLMYGVLPPEDQPEYYRHGDVW